MSVSMEVCIESPYIYRAACWMRWMSKRRVLLMLVLVWQTYTSSVLKWLKPTVEWPY